VRSGSIGHYGGSGTIRPEIFAIVSTPPNQIAGTNAAERHGFVGKSRAVLSPRPGVAHLKRWRFESPAMEKPEKELAVDLAEVAVDAVLQDGLLKDVPIVGTLINLTKLAKSIPDRIFTAKVRSFVAALERVGDLQKDDFLTEMALDHNKRAKLSEVLTLTLDRIDDLEKADYVAYVFMAYVERKIDLTVFKRCLHSISDAFAADLTEFVEFMLTEAKHPLYIPMHLRGLTSGAFARDSKARSAEGLVPYATDMGSKFSEIVGIYRKRSDYPSGSNRHQPLSFPERVGEFEVGRVTAVIVRPGRSAKHL